MSFGQQWLVDWEAEKESKYEPPEPTIKIPSLREMVMSEVSRHLNQSLARELTDKILSIITESKK